MEVFEGILKLRQFLRTRRLDGASIGLIPTMGSLHDGHRRLVEESLKANDVTVCSIYVNRLQFNDSSDFGAYPRTMETDLAMLQEWGCQAVFSPSDEEMYVSQPIISFHLGEVASILEGEFRPGHFQGVAIVVSKLLNIVHPDRAYFGQKDLQQLLIVRQLVMDLSIPTEIVSVPTVRDDNGLAMSSRNQRLSDEERDLASEIFRGLDNARTVAIEKKSAQDGLDLFRNHVDKYPDIKLEYAACMDLATSSIYKGDGLPRDFAFLVAAFLGPVRLIDNVIGKSNV